MSCNACLSVFSRHFHSHMKIYNLFMNGHFIPAKILCDFKTNPRIHAERFILRKEKLLGLFRVCRDIFKKIIRL